MRWSGFLTFVGGLLLAVSGVLMQLWIYVHDQLSTVVGIGHLVGLLLLTTGPIGLVALIMAHENPNGYRIRRLRASGDPSLTWTRRSVVVGLLLAILTVPAAAVLLVANLVCEVFVGGYGPASSGLVSSAFVSSGLLSGLGVPVTTILLGVAVWSSGLLGKWRTLPVTVGVLSILAPIVSVGVTHLT